MPAFLVAVSDRAQARIAPSHGLGSTEAARYARDMSEAVDGPAVWRRPPAEPAQFRNDALGAAGLFAMAILSVVLTRAIGLYAGIAAPPIVSIAVLAAITLPLAARRRHPVIVLLIVAAAFIVAGEVYVEDTVVSNIALFCAVYTVGAWEPDRQRATWARAVCIGAMAVWMVIGMFRISDIDLETGSAGIGALTPNVGLMLQNLLINALYFTGAYWFGNHAWNAARQRAVLQQRTDQLAIEQARVAQQAVTIERMRIARELHDAVAHHVSLMGVQAAAARSILPRDIDGAQAQLIVLEDSARAAVAELYALLGTLRDDDSGPLQATPSTEAKRGLDGLPGLVDEAQAAGLNVTLSVVGERYDVPQLIGLNLYRITQEALTNVTKHAGPGAHAVVTVRYLPNVIELEIADDGRRRAVPPARGIGLGLPSMRERVASLRGELTAGPRSTGGFLVRARIPLAPTSETVSSSGTTPEGVGGAR